MQNLHKPAKIFIIVIFSMLIIIISSSFLNHKIQLSKEAKLLSPIGEMVTINGHNLHVYSEGQGEKTLIFMAGGGTSSPLFDFKTLYSRLSDDYKIVVIEKSGYGFSEDSPSSRDLNTMLFETRESLLKSGIPGPYILFPHSMSGIEALYWAQKHPDEVEAIVGLDMAIPQIYEDYLINRPIINLASFGSKIGITRFFPQVASSSAAIKQGTLTDDEKKVYKAIFYQKTLSKSMRNEIYEIKANVALVNSLGKPHLPILLFISNGEETGWNKNTWIEAQKSYITNIPNSKMIEVDASHYIHNISDELIAKESKSFLNKLP